MKKMIGGSIIAGMLGISIGFMISLGFSLAYSIDYLPSSSSFVNHFSNTSIATLVSALLWCTIGICSYWSGHVFRIQNWSLLKRTMINAILLYLIMLCVGIIAAWFPINLMSLVIFTIIFIVWYLIDWMIQFRRTKRTIAKINHALRKE